MTYPKYVITEYKGIQTVHVFSVCQQHSDVCPLGKSTVVSAGMFEFFVKDGQVDVCCFGKSVSLGAKSDPDNDAFYLRQFFDLPR